jgi:hypothetical protein
MEKKSMLSKLTEKFKSMMVPVSDPNLKIAMDGRVAVREAKTGDWITISDSNEIVRYDESFTIKVPIYTIKKAAKSIAVGDIIKNGNKYGKVLKKDDDGALKCLHFDGTKSTTKPIKDFALGVSCYDVVVNMFNMQGSNMNPLMFAMMNSDEDDGGIDMKSLMMMQMLSGNNGGMNMSGMMNPMMMLGLLSDKAGGSSDKMLEMMMLMSMNQNQGNVVNPFTTMMAGMNDMFNTANAQTQPQAKVPQAKVASATTSVDTTPGYTVPSDAVEPNVPDAENVPE